MALPAPFPGWLLEPGGDAWPRGMTVTPQGAQDPAYRPTPLLLPSSLMAALRRTREQRRCSPPHGFTSAVQGNNDKALSVPDDHLGPPSGKVHGPGMLRCNIAGLPAAKAAAPVPLPCAMECLREAP